MCHEFSIRLDLSAHSLLIYSNVPKCNLVPLQVSTCWGLVSRGGTPCNGLYGEAPPEMGTFLRLQGHRYERVGISLVEVYERVGVISVGKKQVQKGQQMHFVAVKTFWFCDLFTGILKIVQLQQ